jgi:hypothetical protein
MWSTAPSEETTSLQVSEGKWHIYVIDNGIQSSVDVDSSNLPHISYRGLLGDDPSEMVLRYATWNSGNWSIQTVDNKLGAGHTSTLVLDSMDRPTIAQWDLSAPDTFLLEIVIGDDANWTFETIDNDTLGHLSRGLDLGPNELPRISYIKYVASYYGDLWFAEQNPNGTWDFEIIDQNGELLYPSLSVDFRGHYHISYAERGTELRYAYWNGSAWNKETVGVPGVFGSISSMRADDTGTPHIGFYDYGKKMASYATKVNGSWEITPVDYMFAPGPSLDLDSKMRPHLSYQGSDRHLRHAWWNGTSWRIEIADSTPWVGDFSSTRLDENDDIHISYALIDRVNHTGHLIKYATTKELPIGGIETTIDIDPDTLNLKSKGKFITAYIELEGGDVRDVDASSILLNGAISPILDEKYGFVTSEDSYIADHDNDGIMERMVKFDRGEVQKLLAPADEIVLTITGSLLDGIEFEGTDTVRVINPP